MLMSGVRSGVVIRETFELLTWAESYYHQDVFLSEFTSTALDLIRKTGEGSQTWLEPKRMRLPANTEGGTATWHSGGNWANNNSGPIPNAATALQQPEEAQLANCMIKEIRDKLAIALDPSPVFERGLGGQDKPKQSIDFVVAGSSNASKLSKALEDQGFSCSLVFIPNWRVNSSSVEELKNMLKEEIREKDPTTVVLFFLDNSIYYGRQEDGSSVAAKKLEDGNYHIDAEVAVCGRDTLLQHFNAIKPILDQVGRRRGIIVTLMPCYITAGCCSKPGHCSNRRYQDFEQQQLDLVKRYIKDNLFYDGYRSIHVLGPCMDLRAIGMEEAWDQNPVHPTAAAYSRIAAARAKINNRMRTQEVENKRRRESIGEASQSLPDARPGRLDAENNASPALQRGGRGWSNRRPRGSGGSRWPGGNSGNNSY
jgi:hypothetical protein